VEHILDVTGESILELTELGEDIRKRTVLLGESPNLKVNTP
jgi:hypothetical protein